MNGMNEIDETVERIVGCVASGFVKDRKGLSSLPDVNSIAVTNNDCVRSYRVYIVWVQFGDESEFVTVKVSLSTDTGEGQVWFDSGTPPIGLASDAVRFHQNVYSEVVFENL